MAQTPALEGRLRPPRVRFPCLSASGLFEHCKSEGTFLSGLGGAPNVDACRMPERFINADCMAARYRSIQGDNDALWERCANSPNSGAGLVIAACTLCRAGGRDDQPREDRAAVCAMNNSTRSCRGALRTSVSRSTDGSISANQAVQQRVVVQPHNDPRNYASQPGRACKGRLTMKLHFILAVGVLSLAATPVAARPLRILLTNDDGLTSNVKALYEALKADGHDVIVSVPCHGQSGMGAAIYINPLGPLAKDCLNGAAKKGDPGAGLMTRDGFRPDWHYVAGTPVMSLLYGLDIAAKARWADAEPDLVISGPNEGQNVGRIINSSGTVSNAQYAASRGLPAIALSAGIATRDNDELAAPDSAKVARLSLQLVRKLAEGSGKAPLLPRNLALNVNFPDKLEGANWRWSRIGTYDYYKFRFVVDMSSSPLARKAGAEVPAGPRISIDNTETKPVKGQMNDEAVVFRNDIAVSPMQVGFEARPGQDRALSRQLKGLLGR